MKRATIKIDVASIGQIVDCNYARTQAFENNCGAKLGGSSICGVDDDCLIVQSQIGSNFVTQKIQIAGL